LFKWEAFVEIQGLFLCSGSIEFSTKAKKKVTKNKKKLAGIKKRL